MPWLSSIERAETALATITTPAGHQGSAADPSIILLSGSTTTNNVDTIAVGVSRLGVVAEQQTQGGLGYVRNFFGVYLMASKDDVGEGKLWEVAAQARQVLADLGWVFESAIHEVSTEDSTPVRTISMEWSDLQSG